MYYIYERSSTFIMGKMNRRTGLVRPDATKSYKTISAAKTALTKMSKRYRADLLETVNDPVYRYGIADADYFHSTIKIKTADEYPTYEEYCAPRRASGLGVIPQSLFDAIKKQEEKK